MDAELGDALRRALGAEVRRASPLSGGDINDAYEVVLTDGRRVFVKTNSRAPSGMFAAEAHGLEWLAEAGALRIPAVLAHGKGADGEPPFLVLEFLERARTGIERGREARVPSTPAVRHGLRPPPRRRPPWFLQ